MIWNNNVRRSNLWNLISIPSSHKSNLQSFHLNEFELLDYSAPHFTPLSFTHILCFLGLMEYYRLSVLPVSFIIPSLMVFLYTVILSLHGNAV